MDGFRVDATQQFFDASPVPILTEISRVAREAAGSRSIYVIAESEPQDAKLLRSPAQGGGGYDALWNDDFHHAATIAATRHREAYYADYRGTAQEFVSLAKHGFLYQGQLNTRQRKRRGAPAWGLPPEAFICYLQNHDQIANSLRGERIHCLTSPAMFRALTAFQLLGPGTPLLFQGQEFAASAPFLYFADHEAKLARVTAESRLKFLSQFPSLTLEGSRALIKDPADRATFESCKLDHNEGSREGHAEALLLHRELLRLRREDPVITGRTRLRIDGAVLGADALVVRYFGEGDDDRLLFLNLGTDVHLDPAPEPLLAPPEAKNWLLLWSSEDPRYGGCGTPPLESDENWRIPGRTTILMTSTRAEEKSDA